MDMVTQFNLIFSQIAIMALVIGIITYCLRYLIELTPIKRMKAWEEAILPAIPFILGFIFGWYHIYKLSWEFGVIAGFASSYVFRVFKSYMVTAEKRLEKDEEEAVKQADQNKNPDVKV
jgi:hypothetical protein